MRFFASILSISAFSNTSVFGSKTYDAECLRTILGEKSAKRSFQVLLRTDLSTHISRNCNISMNSSLVFDILCVLRFCTIFHKQFYCLLLHVSFLLDSKLSVGGGLVKHSSGKVSCITVVSVSSLCTLPWTMPLFASLMVQLLVLNALQYQFFETLL